MMGVVWLVAGLSAIGLAAMEGSLFAKEGRRQA